MWDFSTEPEFQAKLDWAETFVRTEVEPLDHVLGDPYDKGDEQAQRLIAPLKEQVRAQGLWACHLTPEHGGQGYGQVKLALLNEILGRSRWAPSVFGCQAPDSGNAEILAKYGTADQKSRYLQPLLDGLISSCYSMTEPQAGADPTLFTTRAVRDGDSWVINGEKWFSSNARYASFFLVMAVTNDGDNRHRRMSMFIVPAETPGIHIVRDAGIGTESAEYSSHAYVRYTDVRVPADHLLGEEGDAFAIAQTRLGGGRIHHGMRTLAQVRKAFDLMLERAVSRTMREGRLADLQATQEKVADSWIDIEQFRLLLLRTAWLIDKHDDYREVRKDIAAVKVAMPRVYHDVVQRAMHLHGALGISNEMPFSAMMVDAQVMAVADGPTEVHKWTLAKALLRDATPGEPLFGSGHLPTIREAAHKHVAERLELVVAAL
ncbi:acyl-CoA dehydrogenase family protein [Gordonia hongkongensis]|uniref:Acyl-CoA dehydrogenase family protein n=1 Tax=Gordonia hongkongensis TaxID=1701090 RepID=A0AAX3TCW0_9ACTN|nr:acyl-CoA dehydrogenase family protein [Gordonia hongkongensis]QIK50192.1 acyl-CoA dehydrogenase [Gordonia terrae]WFP27122.1 acyl-CoA dehydrogenase family protein [Gordonia hongkongensis]